MKLTEVGGDYTPIIIEATAFGEDGEPGAREQTYCRLVREVHKQLVSIITLRNRRIFQLAVYHTLQLEEISLLVHF